jgi:hypothetical protein
MKQKIDLERLRPLMGHRPQGDTWVGQGRPRAICVACGAEDGQVMIRKHRRNCQYVAWGKAMEYLRSLLAEAK